MEMNKFKQFLSLLTPPIVNKLFSKFKFRGEQISLIFDSYENALIHCTNKAYEDEELVNVIFKKTKQLANASNLKQDINISQAAMQGLSAVFIPVLENVKKDTPLKVLDFGGACGAHYFQIRNILPSSVKLSWVVVETPTMVKYAKQLETDELKFTTQISEAKNHLDEIDLLYTSGTLQCVNNPAKYLEELIDIQAKWVFFGRLGLNRNNNTIITIHSSKLSWNGVGELPEGHTDKWIKYPFSFISENLFLSIIKKRYNRIFSVEDISGIFPIEGEEIIGYGLFCEKHSQ